MQQRIGIFLNIVLWMKFKFSSFIKAKLKKSLYECRNIFSTNQIKIYKTKDAKENYTISYVTVFIAPISILCLKPVFDTNDISVYSCSFTC